MVIKTIKIYKIFLIKIDFFNQNYGTNKTTWELKI